MDTKISSSSLHWRSRAGFAILGRPLFLFWPRGIILALSGASQKPMRISIPIECLHALDFMKHGQLHSRIERPSSASTSFQTEFRLLLYSSNVSHDAEANYSCCSLTESVNSLHLVSAFVSAFTKIVLPDLTEGVCDVAHWYAEVQISSDLRGSVATVLNDG